MCITAQVLNIKVKGRDNQGSQKESNIVHLIKWPGVVWDARQQAGTNWYVPQVSNLYGYGISYMMKVGSWVGTLQ